MNVNELENEKKHLQNTKESIKDSLEKEKKELDDIISGKTFFNRGVVINAIQQHKKSINQKKKALQKPYFGRVDFESPQLDRKEKLYIGQVGIIGNDSETIVTDWRSPIASLYYDTNIGPASYRAPHGIVSGELIKKRQYIIDGEELIEYYDVDLVNNDILLQKYLNENNDVRLNSIIATIQQEQNDVIRKPFNNNIIVQGVAGSGKTTVALHRLSYLLYNARNNIKQNQFVVIGPNPVFLKYIKTVLPDLEVDGITQNTFATFSTDYLQEDIEVLETDKVNDSIEGKLTSDIDKFKCSKKYKDMIDLFLEGYSSGLTDKDLVINGNVVVPSKDIKELFDFNKAKYGNSSKYGNNTMEKRIELTIDKLVYYIKEDDKYISNIPFSERENVRKKCRQALRSYFNRVKVNPIKLYKDFIGMIEDLDIYKYPYLKELKKQTLTPIKNKKVDFNDLAALIYIKAKTNPNSEYSNIKHVVIDEAQDLGEFNFAALREIFSTSSFSIFGDLAQSIYDYRGIDNWTQVNNIMFDGTGQIINFNKSYRTTAEIMDSADDIAEHIGLNRSDLVIRHGSSVNFEKYDDDDLRALATIEKVDDYVKRGYNTIAIICKTRDESKKVNQKLYEAGLEIPNITVDDDISDSRFRICTISNQLAKGLEFDCVIINNASEEEYNSQSSLDMKLLYVALTRALHECNVIYSGELTAPLKKNEKKQKNITSQLKRNLK